MKTALKIKHHSAQELDCFISLLVNNGYKVSIEKGDRVSKKIIITKPGQDYVGEDDEE